MAEDDGAEGALLAGADSEDFPRLVQSAHSSRAFVARRVVPLVTVGLVTAGVATLATRAAQHPSMLRGQPEDSTESWSLLGWLGLRGSAADVVLPEEVGDTIGKRYPWDPFQSPEQAFETIDRNLNGEISKQRLSSLGLERSTGMMREEFMERFAVEASEVVAAEGPLAVQLSERFSPAALGVHVSAKEPPLPNSTLELRNDGGKGLVHALYTFGAPGTSRDGLYDPSRPDGCFSGYRVFTKSSRYTVGFGTYFQINDPVAYLAAALNFRHSRMEAMEAQDDNFKDNVVHSCAPYLNTPALDHFWAVSLHSVYNKNLVKHTNRAKPDLKPHLERVTAMSHFAMSTYEETQKIGIAAEDFGWNHVGRACAWLFQAGGGCKDRVDLYQDPSTLECVLAFEGTDDFSDWMDNINIAPGDFCGFGGVHSGFKNHLFRMIRGVDYAQSIRAKLPKCKHVAVTGHSLGGAQAEIFVACANRGLKEGDKGYNDYRLIHFEPTEPELLPRFLSEQAPGVFLRNKGNGLCLDVRGTMQTDYQREIIMYNCEQMAGDFTKDQKWDMVEGGFLKNRLSGLCMEPASDGKSILQMPCRIEEKDPSQQWKHTEQGFLHHVKTGKCISSSLALIPCPFTDQKWQLTKDGHLVNLLSGKCLDVKGNPGTKEGTSLVLWDCEHDPKTDQVWEFGPRGHLINKLSGLCANIRNHQGRENKPDLVISKCQATDPYNEMLWTMTEEGFIMHKGRGMCIDVRGRPGTGNGDLVAMAHCEDQFIDSTAKWKIEEGGYIRNVGSSLSEANQCIEVKGDEFAPEQKKMVGAKLHVDKCELVTDQKWEIDPPAGPGQLTSSSEAMFNTGFIRNVIGSRKCLDIRHTPGVASDRLWLQNCEGAQDHARFWDVKWALLADGKLQNKLSLKCLNVQGKLGIESGANIILTKCEDTAQTWTLSEEGFLVNQLSGKCLDVQGEYGTADNTPLVLSPCERNDKDTDQKWELTRDGFLRNRLSWKCAMPGPILDQMVLKSCPQSMQRWEMTEDGFIKNRVTGQCVDAVHNTSVGEYGWWNVVAWNCDQNRLHQQWERVQAE